MSKILSLEDLKKKLDLLIQKKKKQFCEIVILDFFPPGN